MIFQIPETHLSLFGKFTIQIDLNFRICKEMYVSAKKCIYLKGNKEFKT